MLAQAIALHREGQLPEADRIYLEILRLDSANADALHLLGLIRHQQGRNGEAVELIERAINVNGGVAAVQSNLGEAYRALGDRENAIRCYEAALRLDPRFAGAHNNLGIVFSDLGHTEKAIHHYRECIRLSPDYAGAHKNLASLQAEQGELSRAITGYRKALELRPTDAEAYSNLGTALTERGDLQDALAAYRQALRLIADYQTCHDNLLLSLNYDPDQTPEQLYRAHREWGRGMLPNGRVQDFANRLDTDRRLRLGYVSADFRSHSVAFFFQTLLGAHSRQAFELFCYSQVAVPDRTTKAMRAQADHWIDTRGLSDEVMWRRIREDRIDILVDLAGHTPGNRLGVFALRAAPVQISWLGYPATTGLPTMDYRFTDRWADPEGEADGWHTEQLWRLPTGFLCYRPPAATPQTGTPGANDGITFGSFNNMSKVNDRVFGLWSQILRQTPASRLLLKARQLGDAKLRRRVLSRFAAQGIAPERIELIGRIPSQTEHLACYQRVDLALDTFPYNGATTTCEALWMGVPVITLQGRSHAARVGSSILHQCGLEKLVVDDERDYAAKALALATDRDRLRKLAEGLRDRLQASALCDEQAFAGHVEQAYRTMWAHWCHNQTDPST